MDMRSEGRKGKGIPILSQQLKRPSSNDWKKRADDAFFESAQLCFLSAVPQVWIRCRVSSMQVSLTYHRRQQRLRCHLCGHDEHAPLRCPQSHIRAPRFVLPVWGRKGGGNAGQTLPEGHPSTHGLRHPEEEGRLQAHPYGVSPKQGGYSDRDTNDRKGLHFPNVTLVGIIYADLSLHIPDFRSGRGPFGSLPRWQEEPVEAK